MTTNKFSNGNILGGSRAETDNLLSGAFVETSDYQALVNTRDYNFVVGRRGTGKSALFIKTFEKIKNDKLGLVYINVPQEYEQLDIQANIKKITTDYKKIRSITRVAWRLSILVEQLSNINNHHKFRKSDEFEYLEEYIKNNQKLFKVSFFGRISLIIKTSNLDCDSDDELPGKIANDYSIERLFNSVNNLLLDIGKPSYFMFDGLDEGWLPNEIATAILGGLASCAGDILEKQSEIHLILFIRDNIFRSLSYFDGDFSRHIEGNTLRLTWDDSSLLQVVANRLRIALDLSTIENNVKVWNRFAYGELKNQAGFKACLNYTLYRPRDIIVLLNTTYAHVSRGGRHEIVETDIKQASKQISENRLKDLIKEYDTVFPGLLPLIEIFKGQQAFQNYSDIVKMIQTGMDENEYATEAESDYAILGTGKEAFFALYSVGFVGIENPETGALQFCHDGSPANIDASKSEQRCCVHPCYWKALSIQSEVIEESVLIELYDDDKPPSDDDIKDLRTKRIGQIISRLPQMLEGNEDALKFEEWVLSAVKILFSGKLSNPALNPNQDAIQRRDVVATNNASVGFWKKIREDYKSRQVIFEVKNFSDLKLDNIRQALSYSGSHYGKFVIIVNRSMSEALSSVERGWIKEIWDQHGVIIYILPAPVLSKCISKLRTQQRFDYTEDVLDKRLDTYLRSYLSLKHLPKRRSKKKKH